MMGYKIPMARPWVSRADKGAVLKVLSSGRLALGPQAEALESEFAAKHGYKYAVAVNSGMAALNIMSRKLGKWPCITGGTFPPVRQIIRGPTIDRWAPPAGIFMATALYDSNTVEPEGPPWPLWPPSFADWCEAVGTAPANKCDAAYSFYPNKQIGVGEGGMICTQSAARAKWYREARNNGRVGGGWTAAHWGFNYRMPEVIAAQVRSQLRRLETILHKRRTLFRWYDSEFGVKRATPRSIFAYVWEADDKAHRDRVAWALAKALIEFRFTFPPAPGCPEWSHYHDTTLMLPFYTMMPAKHIERVIKVVRSA